MRALLEGAAIGLAFVGSVLLVMILTLRFFAPEPFELQPETVALLREANCKRVTEESEVKIHAIRICTEHMVGCEVSLQDIEAAITAKRRALACR